MSTLKIENERRKAFVQSLDKTQKLGLTGAEFHQVCNNILCCKTDTISQSSKTDRTYLTAAMKQDYICIFNCRKDKERPETTVISLNLNMDFISVQLF